MAGHLNSGSGMPALPGLRGPRRHAALLALVVSVVTVHGCITQHVADRVGDLGAAAAMPMRIEVAYVRELTPSAPPALAPAAPPPAPRVASRPARPASAPAPRPDVEIARDEPAPEPAPPMEPAAPEPAPPLSVEAAPAPAERATAPEFVAPAAVADAASAVPAMPAFEWPGSTRLSYQLTGNVRGEVHGSAQVEWIRAGPRYQVHLDVAVGLPVAPLITRRMSSDGELTSEGLVPRRYDEDTKVMFRERRRLTMLFEADAVVMPNGQRRERWPGVQDTASQFVQMSYLFSVQPEMLRPGGTIELPLALPRNIDRWVYDVLDQETLDTPFGPLEAFHLKPRRLTRPGGDLVAEVWFAPTLRYLPVRIRIQQDADTFIDLVIARRPELSAPEVK
jgi:hypothetical protein